MNKFLILVSLLIVLVSCNEEPIEQIEPNSNTETEIETQSVTLTAYLTDASLDTRVSTNTSNDNSWNFVWESEDAISGWYDNGCVTPNEFVIETFDEQSSTFTGTLGSGDYHRFIYPYDESLTIANDGCYLVDVSSQDGNLNKTYLINDQKIATTDIIDGVVTSLDMKHLGAFMVVDIFLENYNSSKTYSLTKIEYANIPVLGIVDMNAEATSEDIYLGKMKDSVTATLADDCTFEEVVYNGTNYLQAVVNLNIIPFEVEVGNKVSITLTLDVSGEQQEVTATVTNSSASAIEFARATHNYTYITADAGDQISVVDCTINGWVVEVDEELLVTEEETYTLSKINSTNIPEDDTWIITDSGSLTQSNTTNLRAILNSYIEDREITLVFPNITSVELAAFTQVSNMISISLPKATTIGEAAFFNCTSLKSVSLPEVTTLDYQAFCYCSALGSIYLPAATTIGNSIIYGCSSLTTISMPAAITIGNFAFEYCSSLTSVNLPAATTIGNSIFYGCSSLTSVNLPVATSLGNSVFEGCSSLTSVNLPAATEIGSYMFSDCINLNCIKLTSSNEITYSSYLIGIYSDVDENSTLYINIINKGLGDAFDWKEVIYVDSDGNIVE